MATNQAFYSWVSLTALLLLTAWCMKLDLKMFMPILVRKKKYLTLVIIIKV